MASNFPSGHPWEPYIFTYGTLTLDFMRWIVLGYCEKRKSKTLTICGKTEHGVRERKMFSPTKKKSPGPFLLNINKDVKLLFKKRKKALHFDASFLLLQHISIKGIGGLFKCSVCSQRHNNLNLHSLMQSLHNDPSWDKGKIKNRPGSSLKCVNK